MSFCPRCGTEIKKGEKFCRNCGNAVNRGQSEEKTEKAINDGKKKKGIIFAVIFLILAGLISACLIFSNAKKEKEYNHFIAMAEKYIEEQDYEQAEIAYLEAIEIDEKQMKPYLGIAKIYIEQGDYGEAEKILTLLDEKRAKGSEEEVQEKEELVQMVRSFLEGAELTEATIYEIIVPFSVWIYERMEDVEELSMTQKVENCAFLAFTDGSYSDDMEYIYSKKEIDIYMKEYFGELPDYSKVEDTQYIKVTEDKVKLSLDFYDFDYMFEEEIVSWEQREDYTYDVEVDYYLLDRRTFNVIYNMAYNPAIENQFYIKNMKVDCMMEEFVRNILVSYTWAQYGYRLSDSYFMEFYQDGTFDLGMVSKDDIGNMQGGTYELDGVNLTIYWGWGEKDLYRYNIETDEFFSSTHQHLAEQEYVDENGTYHEPEFAYSKLEICSEW